MPHGPVNIKHGAAIAATRFRRMMWCLGDSTRRPRCCGLTQANCRGPARS